MFLRTADRWPVPVMTRHLPPSSSPHAGSHVHELDSKPDCINVKIAAATPVFTAHGQPQHGLSICKNGTIPDSIPLTTIQVNKVERFVSCQVLFVSLCLLGMSQRQTITALINPDRLPIRRKRRLRDK